MDKIDGTNEAEILKTANDNGKTDGDGPSDVEVKEGNQNGNGYR